MDKNISEKKITSCSNNLIKKVCSLRSSSRRAGESAYIFEGTKLFAEACSWQIPLTHVFYTDKWLDRADLIYRELLYQCSCEIINVSEAVMEKLSGQKNGEGIFCRAEKKATCQLSPTAYVFLENVQDPGNAGTIIRSADAAGFTGIIASEGTADLYSEKVLRASMGSVFHLPLLTHADGEETMMRLKAQGFTIIGSALEGSEALFSSLHTIAKPVIIMGNESKGMSNALRQQCDVLVRIPMKGHAESLNVSTAAGLLLYKTAGII